VHVEPEPRVAGRSACCSRCCRTGSPRTTCAASCPGTNRAASTWWCRATSGRAAH
jgi:hypothetical protein